MPTPAKPFSVLSLEGKSHRTKAELLQRKQAESSLASGKEFKESKEVRENEVAHKEFIRLKALLKNIEKNDALHENIINRYCLMIAECKDFEKKRELFQRDLEELTNEKDKLINSEEITLTQYYKMKNAMQKNILAVDKQIQTKRKMLLDIEKENIMTIASALRNIPKKVEKKTNALREALNG